MLLCIQSNLLYSSAYFSYELSSSNWVQFPDLSVIMIMVIAEGLFMDSREKSFDEEE
jgi:hypothetical protein